MLAQKYLAKALEGKVKKNTGGLQEIKYPSSLEDMKELDEEFLESKSQNLIQIT